MRSPRWRWLRDPRSWGLQFCAGVCLSRMLAYFTRPDEKLPIGLAEVAQVLPVAVYGALWFVTAVSLMMVAIRCRSIARRSTWLAATPILWGALYLVGGVFSLDWNSLTSAYLFACLAGIIVSLLVMRPRGEL